MLCLADIWVLGHAPESSDSSDISLSINLPIYSYCPEPYSDLTSYISDSACRPLMESVSLHFHNQIQWLWKIRPRHMHHSIKKLFICHLT